MFDRVAGFFFGRDIFVSYSYDDSRYAEALAVELQRRKFSVFLGGWGASPGEKLSRNVVRAAERCHLLVIVATPAAVESKAVQEEIAVVSKRNRTVVPIDINGAIGDRRRWPGTDPVPDQRGDSPSSNVISRVENAEQFARQEVRLRRFIAAIAGTAVMLIAGSGWFLHRAKLAREGAEMRAAAADEKAITSSRAALAKRKELDSMNAQMSVVAGEKERQAKIAAAMQIANDANLLLQREPGRLTRAALLAAASVRQLHAVGERSLGSDSAIRAVAALLPQVVRKKPVKLEDLHIASRNRRFVATSDEKRFAIVVYDLDRRTAPRAIDFSALRLPDRHPSIYPRPQAISNDGRTLILDDTRSIRLWHDGVLVKEPIGSHVAAVALSDDGQRIAIAEMPGADSERKPWTIRIRSRDGTGKEFSTSCPPAIVYPLELQFSPSSHLLAMYSLDTAVWDYETGKDPISAPWKRGEDPHYIVFHENEEIVATFGARPLEIWEWRKWRPNAEPRWTDTQSERGVSSVAFSDYVYVVYIGAGGEARLAYWNSEESRPIARLDDGGPSNRKASLVAAAEGASARIAVAYDDSTVTEYDGEKPIARVAHAEPVETLGYRDGNITSATRDEAWIWTGAPLDRVIVKGFPERTSVSPASPSGKFVLDYDVGGLAAVRPATGGKPTPLPDSELAFDAVFVDDEKVVLMSSEEIDLWRWRERHLLWRMPLVNFAYALDPNRKFLAAAVADGREVSIFTMDTPTPTAVASLRHRDGVKEIAFSRSGEFMMTIDGDRLARVWTRWNTAAPVEVSRLTMRTDINTARFSEDDHYILLGTGDSFEAWTERFVWRDEDFLQPVCKRLDLLTDAADRALYAEACPRNSHPLRASK